MNEDQIRIDTVRLALLQIAGWGETSPEELTELAEEVGRFKPGIGTDPGTCPMCQETWCDEDCPLWPVRSKYERGEAAA